MRCGSKPSTACRTSAPSRWRRGRRPSGRAGSRRRNIRHHAGRARAPARAGMTPVRRRPPRPGRRPRRRPHRRRGTATAWSATTSSTTSERAPGSDAARQFPRPRAVISAFRVWQLALCMRPCFDRRGRMSRAKHSARGVLAVVLLGVCGTQAVAAPYGADRREARPAAAPGPRSAEAEARRRDEADALQRQDIADALRRLYNSDVDWRTTPLDRLIDIRVRAARAADLQERLGVSVDWRRYSWIELEALRRTLMSFEGERSGRPETAAATPMPAEAQL